MIRYLNLSLALLLACFTSQAQSLRLLARIDSANYQGNQTIDSYKLAYAPNMGMMDPVSFGGPGQWAAEKITQHTFTTNSGQYDQLFTTLQHFDTDDRITSRYSVSSTGDTFSRILFYYSNDHCDSVVNEAYVNGVYVHWYKESYTYGTDGMTLALSIVWNTTTTTWDSSKKITFTYSGGQPLQRFREDWLTGAWVPQERYSYTYNGNVLDTEIKESYDQQLGWYIDWKQVYTYDVNDDLVTTLGLEWNGTTFENDYKYEYTYDNNHNKLWEDFYQANGNLWSYYKTWKYTYNNANYITMKVHGYLDNSTFYEEQDNWPKTVYFYEEYTNMSVGDTEQQKNTVSIYPNPANGTINIRMMTGLSSPFSITIFDATGRSVKHWNEAPATFYQKQADVSDLPSGNYFLRISDRPQEAVQFTIVR